MALKASGYLEESRDPDIIYLSLIDDRDGSGKEMECQSLGCFRTVAESNLPQEMTQSNRLLERNAPRLFFSFLKNSKKIRDLRTYIHKKLCLPRLFEYLATFK